jgi:hypothetical protein
MPSPPPDPPITDVAPRDRNLTGYDQQHLVTYLRLLDADAEGADWQEVAKIVLHIDPEREPDRAKRAWGESFGPSEVAAQRQWQPAVILAIAREHVEDIELRLPVAIARVQRGEAGDAIGTEHDRLAVDHEMLLAQLQRGPSKPLMRRMSLLSSSK